MRRDVEEMVDLILGTVDGTVFRDADGNALVLTADDRTLISVTPDLFPGAGANTSSAEGLDWETGWQA